MEFQNIGHFILNCIDDSTNIISHFDCEVLRKYLSMYYVLLENFYTINKLKINDDKTHLVVITSSQKRARTQSANLVEIRTPDKIIKPQKNEKLLGCRIQDDMRWTQYLRDNDENIMKQLNQKLSALQLLSKLADFKTRKMLANGVFMSKLSYMIEVWGSCTKEVMDSLQVLQNRAAKVVTRNSWDMRTKDNLQQIGWLSVYQLSIYHSIVLNIMKNYS